eukprot:scaffold123674_cov36-Prasinocladus_malaysianus.AAC.1
MPPSGRMSLTAQAQLVCPALRFARRRRPEDRVERLSGNAPWSWRHAGRASPGTVFASWRR